MSSCSPALPPTVPQLLSSEHIQLFDGDYALLHLSDAADLIRVVRSMWWANTFRLPLNRKYFLPASASPRRDVVTSGVPGGRQGCSARKNSIVENAGTESAVPQTPQPDISMQPTFGRQPSNVGMPVLQIPTNLPESRQCCGAAVQAGAASGNRAELQNRDQKRAWGDVNKQDSGTSSDHR